MPRSCPQLARCGRSLNAKSGATPELVEQCTVRLQGAEIWLMIPRLDLTVDIRYATFVLSAGPLNYTPNLAACLYSPNDRGDRTPAGAGLHRTRGLAGGAVASNRCHR